MRRILWIFNFVRTRRAFILLFWWIVRFLHFKQKLHLMCLLHFWSSAHVDFFHFRSDSHMSFFYVGAWCERLNGRVDYNTWQMEQDSSDEWFSNGTLRIIEGTMRCRATGRLLPSLMDGYPGKKLLFKALIAAISTLLLQYANVTNDLMWLPTTLTLYFYHESGYTFQLKKKMV